MTIHEAINRVLGQGVATAIINNQGLHWAALAAMADCKVSHGSEVKQAISDYFAALKNENAQPDRGNID